MITQHFIQPINTSEAGLIAWYPFYLNIPTPWITNDMSGNGRDLTLGDGITPSTRPTRDFNRFGDNIQKPSLKGDGLNQYAINNTSGWTMPNNFSISFWYKPNSVIDDSGIFSFDNNIANFNEFYLREYHINNGFRLVVFDNVGSVLRLDVSDVLTTKWSYISVIKTTTALKLFINCKLEGSIPYTLSNTINSSILRLFSLRTSIYRLNGNIDDFRYYNKILTTPEIKALYRLRPDNA